MESQFICIKNVIYWDELENNYTKAFRSVGKIFGKFYSIFDIEKDKFCILIILMMVLTFPIPLFLATWVFSFRKKSHKKVILFYKNKKYKTQPQDFFDDDNFRYFIGEDVNYGIRRFYIKVKNIDNFFQYKKFSKYFVNETKLRKLKLEKLR